MTMQRSCESFFTATLAAVAAAIVAGAAVACDGFAAAVAGPGVAGAPTAVGVEFRGRNRGLRATKFAPTMINPKPNTAAQPIPLPARDLTLFSGPPTGAPPP